MMQRFPKPRSSCLALGFLGACWPECLSPFASREETFWCLGVMFREHVIPSDSGKLHMSVLHGLRGISYAAHLIYVLFSMRNSAKHLVIRQPTRPLTRADLFSESGSASKKSLQL